MKYDNEQLRKYCQFVIADQVKALQKDSKLEISIFDDEDLIEIYTRIDCYRDILDKITD